MGCNQAKNGKIKKDVGLQTDKSEIQEKRESKSHAEMKQNDDGEIRQSGNVGILNMDQPSVHAKSQVGGEINSDDLEAPNYRQLKSDPLSNGGKTESKNNNDGQAQILLIIDQDKIQVFKEGREQIDQDQFDEKIVISIDKYRTFLLHGVTRERSFQNDFLLSPHNKKQLQKSTPKFLSLDEATLLDMISETYNTPQFNTPNELITFMKNSNIQGTSSTLNPIFTSPRVQQQLENLIYSFEKNQNNLDSFHSLGHVGSIEQKGYPLELELHSAIYRYEQNNQQVNLENLEHQFPVNKNAIVSFSEPFHNNNTIQLNSDHQKIQRQNIQTKNGVHAEEDIAFVPNFGVQMDIDSHPNTNTHLSNISENQNEHLQSTSDKNVQIQNEIKQQTKAASDIRELQQQDIKFDIIIN